LVFYSEIQNHFNNEKFLVFYHAAWNADAV